MHSSVGTAWWSLQDTPPASSQGQARIEVATELVLVNVVARDKSGNLVRDLKKEDFTLFEDGKKQAITSFDFENVDVAAGPTEATVSGAADSGKGALLRTGKKAPASLDARDRRPLASGRFLTVEFEVVLQSFQVSQQFRPSLVALLSVLHQGAVDNSFQFGRSL